MAATLGAVDMKAVTGVGAPSYTSGVHMWNGTALILNASPATMNTTPITSPAAGCSGRSAQRASWAKSIEPLKP